MASKNIVEKQEPVDAVVLGGTGLQETQLKSIQKALQPLGIEVFAAHAGEEHDKVVEEMINNGYTILITQIASDGLNNWLGKTITKDNWKEFKKDSVKYGFHVGGEGGYYDTLITDAPLFSKKLEPQTISLTRDDDYCGHIVISKHKLVNKAEVLTE